MVILDEVRDSDEPEAIGGKKSPLRRCIVTATVQAKGRLIRFVVAPDGTLAPDLEERLPGRGHWVTADRAILARAVSKHLFAKAARRAVRVDPELVDKVADLLHGRCLDLLGLARRGGQAVTGFEKVREVLKAGKAAVLIGAVDGAEDGRSKLRGLARGLPEVVLFEASALGAALGRDIAVHAALAPGRMAERFLAECQRYAGFAPGRMTELQLRPGAGERNQTTS